MGAPPPVDELEIGEHRLSAAGEPDREPVVHRVEEQRLVALLALGLPHLLARTGRNEDLRLEPGGGDLGRLRGLGREEAV